MRSTHENPLAYGGTLLKTRRGRAKPRPISFGPGSQTMHLVLRSTKASGKWSFRTPRNFSVLQKILQKFALKHRIEICDLAINLNHFHLHVRISTRPAYMKFIRAISAAIAMLVTGASRWNPLQEKFWDRRPFSRIVLGAKGRETMRDYIRINQLEASGCNRFEARFYMSMEKGAAEDRKRWQARKSAKS